MDRIRMQFSTIGRTGPGMKQVIGFRIGPREGVLLGRIWGAPLCPMATLRLTCATVPQPSELRLGVVRAVY